MEKFIGGFILLSQDDNHKCIELVNYILSAFNVQYSNANFSCLNSKLSYNDIDRYLGIENDFIMDYYFEGIYCEITFKTNVINYNVIGIKTSRIDWIDISKSSTISLFKEHWISLCDNVNAEFGYFGNFEFQTTTQYIDDELIIPVLSHDINMLLVKQFWLTYIGKQITLQWDYSNTLMVYSNYQWLPKGSIVFNAGRGSNPVTGDV